MGMKIEDIDFDGPFTKDQAEYIEQRARLREVLRASGRLHLLDPENLVDSEGDPLDEPIVGGVEKQGDVATLNKEIEDLKSAIDERDNLIASLRDEITSLRAAQPEGSGSQDDDSAPEFEPTDRSEWDFDDLGKEIDERNEKITAFNENLEDGQEPWDLLDKPRSTKDRIEVLEASDRALWEAQQADEQGEGEGDQE